MDDSKPSFIHLVVAALGGLATKLHLWVSDRIAALEKRTDAVERWREHIDLSLQTWRESDDRRYYELKSEVDRIRDRLPERRSTHTAD